MHGQFRCWYPRKKGLILPPEPDFIIPNRIVDEGEEEFLKMIFRDATEVAGGANFYIGLCNQTPSESTVLADINTEPDGSGGYARQPVERNATGWPTLEEVNGHKVIRSKVVNFESDDPAGFSATFTRAFLASVASGAGVLYGFSGALVSEFQLEYEEVYPMQYEFYLD